MFLSLNDRIISNFLFQTIVLKNLLFSYPIPSYSRLLFMLFIVTLSREISSIASR